MRPELAGEFGQELIHGDRRTADELLEQAVDIAAFALDVVGLEIKERVGLPFEHAPIEQGLALHLGRNIHVLNVAAGVLCDFFGKLGVGQGFWPVQFVRFVDARDIADVAAKALAGGEYAGKTYELNGPEALTYAELAEKITKHSGRDVQYVDIPPEVQRKALLDRGMLEWQADALLDLQAYYVKGKGGNVDGLLEQLIGRPPITMDQFLSEFPSEFRPHVEVQALADAATA